VILDNMIEPRATDAKPVSAPARWQGQLELWLEPRAGKTSLVRRRHIGPLVVQRPFYPERDGTTHIYLLHPPGGVAGGDQLEITCHLAPGAKALLTTPGATKFYRSTPNLSEMRTIISLADDAVCEFFPQETILFDGADASMETLVHLSTGAIYVGWDFISFGRPAANERFTFGTLRQRTSVLRDGRPIWFERLRVDGGSTLLDARFGLAGNPILGTMICAGPSIEGLADKIRETNDHVGFSVSQLERTLVCRYLGSDISEAKLLFTRAWEILRPGILGKPAVAPRIWST